MAVKIILCLKKETWNLHYANKYVCIGTKELQKSERWVGAALAVQWKMNYYISTFNDYLTEEAYENSMNRT